MTSNKQKNFVSAVVYVRNDEDTINQFLTTLCDVLEENFEKYEIILLNDASKDASRELIKNFQSRGGMITLVNMSYPQGLEGCMYAGLDLAIGDFVFEFDRASMDYERELIMQAYHRSLAGFDIVACGRENVSAFSKLFYWIYNNNSGGQYKLKSETFRLISRRAINRIHSMSIDIPYRKAVYCNCGLKMDFIGYASANADKKKAVKGRYDTATTTLIMFTTLGYQIALLFSLIMMTATLASVVYIITVYATGSPVEGWTTTMLLVSFGFFMLCTILTIVIKYLSIILKLVFRRQKYLIESVEKGKGS